MSLADQWSPSSVQVTVLQARGLRIKGKSGTNDAYAVMQVGKEKFQTSVAEKSVAPVWKEEAAFDLPPLIHGAHGSERGTLHVHVLHRALVGPDKLLGQAVINLLQLSEDKTRSKTEWFKLLDKSGKPDKDRGEVLLDIQFMRNNMTASMFDLSAAGKSRSRLGKFKDKVRGKKKESDSGSNTLPSFTQVLTDSEDEANGGEAAASKDGKNKKHKMKSLFSPKSNLQKNMSQSMSVLPGKNSTLSGSQSSGLNVDSSEGKKKFKFKIHKRSGSSDGKDSSSGLQKQLPAEQSNLCINGSHIYCEEPPSRTSRIGSNFSLASSGHGSMEEVPENSPPSVDSLRAVTQYSPWTEEEEEEEVENRKEDESRRMEEEEELQRLAEEEERRRVEEQRVKRGQEEEERRLAEEKRRLEEEERRKMEEENERRQREEEEKIRMEEERAQEERRRQEEEEKERVRREEERKLVEEKRRLEEEERMRMEEEERRREERRERVRKEKEEYERLMEEKRKLEEEKKRIEAEERRKRMEEERMRKEEQERKQREEEETRRREEEEKARKEREEEERLMEEKRKLEEEKERMEAEEKLRKEEERVRMEEEKRRQEEQEKKRIEEEKRQREEEERLRMEEEKMRREEEERIKKEELRRREEEEKARKEKEEYERLMEEKRKVEEEKERIEAEERIRKEEEERVRIEEEVKARKEKEEYERLVEEKRRLEEEKERIEAEERIRKEEEERVRMEEERRRREEEEKLRKEKEEYERLIEEKRKLEEEKERIEAEEKLRKEEERIRMEEERRREEEEERIRVEEEKRQREEEERRRVEEERARKEKEERLEEERMKEEEQRRRIEEEERIRKEEQERIKMEEKRRQEEEKARKEKEEMERLAEKRRREKEEEKRRMEEEERKGKEETRRLEKEKLKRYAEEQKKKMENKDGQKAAGKKSKLKSSAEVCSTNPFDENYSCNPFEEIPDSPPGGREENVQQRRPSAASSLGSRIVSADEKELVGAQREKRPAPQPPGRNQAEKASQREQDASARQNKMQNKDRDFKTVSVPPQRSVQMIAPVSRSPADSSAAKETTSKHSKRPAPLRPPSVEEEPKPTSTAEIKHTAYGLNPFEDDDDDDKNDPGSVCWPPAADKDSASQTKTKSSKVARAPRPPQSNGTLITQNTEGGCVEDDSVPDGAVDKACDPQPEAVNPTAVQESPVEAGVKKEGPPVAARRLQPVKPLNSVEQQSVSMVQGENKSTGIHSEAQDKAKVNDSGLKGPFSQLTQEELISLVLKQENQLSERDKKIAELEQYIDNLLVRVIEEQPSILMSMNALKKAA